MPGYVKNWNVTYDPEKAKQLIAESQTPNGIELEALCVNLTENIQLAEALQYYWRQVGINVKITQGAQAALRQRSDNGDYQISPSYSNWATGDPSRPTQAYNGLRPLGLRLPPEVDKELAGYWQRALAEIDVPKRMEVYREFQEKIKEQWVFIPLAHKKLSYVTTKQVEGFYPAPSGSPELMVVKVKK
jgi:peptide/nickel transport system substrate-binding protein